MKADPSFSQVTVGVVGIDWTEQLRVAEFPTTTFLNVGLLWNSETQVEKFTRQLYYKQITFEPDKNH